MANKHERMHKISKKNCKLKPWNNFIFSADGLFKKTVIIKGCWGCGVTGTLICYYLAISYEAKHTPTLWSNNFTSRHTPKKD